MNRLNVPPDLYDRLIDEARAVPEVEICGLLAGHGEMCSAVYPVRNIAPTPQCTFYMDPQEQIAAMAAMRACAETMLGIYHSHPHTAPMPSARDIAGSAYPRVAYVIISLRNREQPEMAAFLLKSGECKPMRLTRDFPQAALAAG